MKKLLILPLILLLAIGFVLAATVNRDMPSRADPGSGVTAKLTLSGANAGEGTAIEEIIPDTITIKSWDISGSKEAKSAVGYTKKASKTTGFTRHSWTFTAASSSPSITYKFDAPSTEGNLKFDVRWITSDGFSHKESSLAVRTVKCGDGICEGSENSDNCEADCPKPKPPAPKAPAAKEKPKANVGVIIAIIAIIIIIVAVVLSKKKKK